MRTLRILLGIGLCTALMSCATTTATPIRGVDFMNMDYAPYAALAPEAGYGYRVVNGKLERPRGQGSFHVRQVEHTDLDANGQPDTLVWTSDNTGGTGNFSMLSWFHTLPDGSLRADTIAGGDRSEGGIHSFQVNGRMVLVNSQFGDAACCANGVIRKTFAVADGRVTEQRDARVLRPLPDVQPTSIDLRHGNADVNIATGTGQFFSFHANTNQTLTAALSAARTDTYLQLFDPNGVLLTPETGTSKVALKLPATGTYVIGVLLTQTQQEDPNATADLRNVLRLEMR